MEFDIQKLKKRPSFPFETIAVGLSFSSRTEPLLSEAGKIAMLCGSKLILIHVGSKTKEKEKQLDGYLFSAGIDARKARVIWAEGDVVDTLLKLCKLNIVDLLILGALEKENILRFYLGSIARKICRKAKCSVLLLTGSFNGNTRHKVVINAGPDHPKSLHTINTAAYFSKHLGIRELTLVQEIHSPALAMAMAESSTAPEVTRFKKELTENETQKLHHLVSHCDVSDLKIKEKVVKGKPGYAVRQYAVSRKADLLVINSPDTHLTFLDRIFTHDMEYILADLPCNLLIVHSRI